MPMVEVRAVDGAPFRTFRLCRRLRVALCLAGLLSSGVAIAQSRLPEIVRVGPTRDIHTLGEAAHRARDGDTVEVDAGDYRRDVAVWTQDRLTLLAVGGRVRLWADGESAEDKAIWVIRGGRVRVQGFDFSGTRVPARNGAGIRFESGQLSVIDCRFLNNEMGLLTSNDPHAELSIEDSEFADNKREDGHDHNLYAGSIARLSVRGSYFHHATTGHLLKSRAHVNAIFYNRLTDEDGGRASYELEFPNGGVAVVVGNIIEQGLLTENPIVVSYGAEGYHGPENTLVMASNTLVDKLPRNGVFLRVVPGDVRVIAVNNLLFGNGTPLEAAGPGEYRNNIQVPLSVAADPANDDYRVRRAALALVRAIRPGNFEGLSLAPTWSYDHPRSRVPLRRGVRVVGALQDLAGR